MTLLALVVWALLPIAVLCHVLNHKYQYYSVAIKIREQGFDKEGEYYTDEDVIKNNIRKSGITDRWEISRPMWVPIIPSLPFIFREKFRRYVWTTLPADKIMVVERALQQIAKKDGSVAEDLKTGVLTKLVFTQRSDLPEPEGVQKKNRRIQREQSIISELRKNRYPC